MTTNVFVQRNKIKSTLIDFAKKYAIRSGHQMKHREVICRSFSRRILKVRVMYCNIDPTKVGMNLFYL